MSWPNYDRRLHQRHPARMLVRATRLPNRARHESATGHTVDFGIGGCSVRFDEAVHLRPRQRVHLAIVTTINDVAHIRHRFATVAHVTNGIVGFATEVWSAQAERDIDVWLKK